MKRRLDICRQCQFFDETKQTVTWINMKTGDNGVKEESFFKCALEEWLMSEESFNRMEVPDDCSMKTEYFVSEWNRKRRNENGHS